MRKTLRVTASMDGWYSIRVSCDEGFVVINKKLEAGKVLELSFKSGSSGVQYTAEEIKGDSGNKKKNKREA